MMIYKMANAQMRSVCLVAVYQVLLCVLIKFILLCHEKDVHSARHLQVMSTSLKNCTLSAIISSMNPTICFLVLC
uniref:Putative ovule protein n=1 Tax=Solanum chacoense TaxID=4108 RepID=A0A0V0GNU6_SOLCH